MKRADKHEQVDRLKDELASIRHAILVEYKGVKVPEVTELRAQIRKTGGHYRVIKNKLLTRAIAGAPLAALANQLTGPTALVWNEQEPVSMAKALSAFAKTSPTFKCKALLVDGSVLPGNQLDAVATMPSQDELRQKLVSLLAAPMRGLVTVLSAPSRNLAAVIKQRADKL